MNTTTTTPIISSILLACCLATSPAAETGADAGSALTVEAAADSASDAPATGFSDEERRLLAAAQLTDPDDPLLDQRAGEFYEQPLFWGGVLAGVVLLILL